MSAILSAPNSESTGARASRPYVGLELQRQRLEVQIRVSDAVPGSRHEPGAEYLGVRMHREDEADADDEGEGRVVEVVATFKVARLGS